MLIFALFCTVAMTAPIDLRKPAALTAGAITLAAHTAESFISPVGNNLARRPYAQVASLPGNRAALILNAFKDNNEMSEEAIANIQKFTWRPVMSSAEMKALADAGHEHVALDRFQKSADRWMFLQDAIIEEQEKSELDAAYGLEAEGKIKVFREELKKTYKDLMTRGASWDNEDAKAFVKFREDIYQNPKYLQLKLQESKKMDAIRKYYQEVFGQQNAEAGRVDHPTIDSDIEKFRRRLDLLWKNQPPPTASGPLNLE